MADRRLLVIRTQYKKIIAAPDCYTKYYMDEHNNDTWYVLLSGIYGEENEYKDGEYLVKIVLPMEYPQAPPEFYFMTPSGLYAINKKVCISIGEFHKNDYPAALKVQGFILNLVSGFIGWRTIGDGIGLLVSSADEKAMFAKQSREYNNTHYSAIINKIENTYREYSAQWAATHLQVNM